jgi:hypothetical protein
MPCPSCSCWYDHYNYIKPCNSLGYQREVWNNLRHLKTLYNICSSVGGLKSAQASHVAPAYISHPCNSSQGFASVRVWVTELSYLSHSCAHLQKQRGVGTNCWWSWKLEWNAYLQGNDQSFGFQEQSRIFFMAHGPHRAAASSWYRRYLRQFDQLRFKITCRDTESVSALRNVPKF